MTKDCPGNVAVFQLLNRDLTSEGSSRLVKNVLSSDFDFRSEVIASKEEIEGGWGNDDLWYSTISISVWLLSELSKTSSRKSR